MVSLFNGIIIWFASIVVLIMVLILIAIVILEIFGEELKHKIKPNKLKLLLIVMVMLLLSILITIQVSINASRSWIKQYEISKETIETSVDNEKLSGFERVELVKLANDINRDLVAYQYKCSKWYGFDISKDVLKLIPVDFN